MFLKASRIKLRFSTTRGVLSVEDLWDLKLEELDALAKSLNKAVKASAEESFIKKTSAADKVTELSFEIVKEVIRVKLEEQEARKLAADKRAKRAQIMELIEKKETEALGGKSLEELKKELEVLENE